MIVGGGVAGLAAADSLHAARVRVLVLEARDRWGGRVYTQRVDGFALPIEMGAEFVHGRVPDTLAVADGAGLLLCEVAGEWWRAEDGRLGPATVFPRAMESVMSRLDAERTPDRSFTDFLNSLPPDPALARAASLARQFVEGFDAADPDRVGERWLGVARAASYADQSDRMFRIVEGYDAVATALGHGIPGECLRLSTVVREIEWSPEGVVVRAPGLTATARAAIITVPHAVLTASPDGTPGPIAFRPPLPSGVRRALEGFATGSAVRVTLRFREAFWETLRASDGSRDASALSFLSTQDPDFRVWWTPHPLRAPVLTAWTAGPHATGLATLPGDALGDRALAALGRQLGVGHGRLEALLSDVWYHDWDHDPLARGAYTYGLVGGIDAPLVLARPIEGALFLAGEATDPDGRSGTVHAAIASGRRAARAVLAGVTR